MSYSIAKVGELPLKRIIKGLLRRIAVKAAALAGTEIQFSSAPKPKTAQPPSPPQSEIDIDFGYEPELKDAILSGWFNNDSGELIEGFTISAQDTVLDVGCGEGVFTVFCASQGAKVIYADIDGEKVAKATEKLTGTPAKELVPLVSDANPLPLEDGVANKIVAMEVMEHVEDPEAFLAELVRVGCSGATYLITVPDPESESVQVDLAPDSYFQHPNHIRVVGRDEFESLVEAAGLIIEKRTSYGFYWTIWWCFFWACKQDLSPPWHPLLKSWNKTWGHLLNTEQGPQIKKVLDTHLPKSQAIIARKP